MKIIAKSLFRSVVARKRLLLITLVVIAGVPLAMLGISYAAISPNEKYVVDISDGRQIAQRDIAVGLVLGAGVNREGRPYKELQARLDTAAKALRDGQVDKLLLSGDNRFDYYDEPTAMKRYLVERYRIDPAKLQEDFAGRSTYESCERAAKVFKLQEVVIFSATSHLPRAIYLCRHFGVEAYGVGNTVEANNATRREALARVKVLFNVYVNGENTILGSPIRVAP